MLKTMAVRLFISSVLSTWGSVIPNTGANITIAGMTRVKIPFTVADVFAGSADERTNKFHRDILFFTIIPKFSK